MGGRSRTVLTHASVPGTLPTCLPRASCPSEISCGCSQATRTAALSLRCGTAPGAAVHRDGLSNSYATRESWNTEPYLCSAQELILHGSRIGGGGGGGRFLGRCTNTGAALCNKSLPTRPCVRNVPSEEELKLLHTTARATLW